MSEDVLDHFPPSFPSRFRGYDRDAVDNELRELRSALDYAQAERDRAVARALALESGAVGDQASASASATVQWLIDSAEQDAGRIRAAAEEAAQEITERAEELLRRRVDLVEEAQHEADECRAQAAEEARQIVHEALEKASTMLRGLQESEVSLHEMFGSGALSHRMPPPRRSAERSRGQHAAEPEPVPPPASQPTQPTQSAPSAAHAQPVPHPRVQSVPQPVPQSMAQPVQQQPVPQAVPQHAHAAVEGQQSALSQVAGGQFPPQVPVDTPMGIEPPRV